MTLQKKSELTKLSYDFENDVCKAWADVVVEENGKEIGRRSGKATFYPGDADKVNQLAGQERGLHNFVNKRWTPEKIQKRQEMLAKQRGNQNG